MTTHGPDFRSSFEPDDLQPITESAPDSTNVRSGLDRTTPGMATWVGDGPDTGFSTKRGVGFTGRHSLAYSGHHDRPGAAHSYNTIFTVDVPVTADSRLSYKIFPRDLSDGAELPAAAASVAVDLVFSDGTRLRDLGVPDRNGFALTARGHGESRVLFANHWNSITADIGRVAAGKTISAVLLDYERTGEPGSFTGWVDDIAITDAPAVEHDHLSDWVDIRRGTNSSVTYSRGNNIPAVAVPHGFNFWAPITDAGATSWNYHYQLQNNADNLPALQALALSHQLYVWGGDRLTLQVMPSTDPGLPNADRVDRALPFRHQDEIATAHYYAVTFTNQLRAEIAPTDHAAIFRFTFPSDTGSLIFDNISSGSGHLGFAEDQTLQGYTETGSDRMYVYARFDQQVIRSDGSQTGRPGGSCRFDTSQDDVVIMRIATSLISVEQAQRNLDLEVGTDDFDTIRERAQRSWDDRLGVITDVEGAGEEQLISLYSNLYRMHLYQNSIFENTGTADRPRYQYASPFLPATAETTATHTGRQLVDGKMYRSSGFWDTYRTTWPALALFCPEEAGELMDGVVRQFSEAGWFPTGMVGSCSDASITDLYNKGVRNFDVDAAYEVLLKHATVVSDRRGVGRPGLSTGIFLGYTPLSTGRGAAGGASDEGMADALENYLGDFGIAAMARSLYESTGRQRYLDEHRYFLNRARNYVNHFDPAVGFFQGRHADGRFRLSPQQYDPREWGYDYTETNGWGMAFSVPQDGRGLANLYGGREQLAEKLDTFFSTPEQADHPGSYGAVIHEVREAAGVQMGQWGLSNQPGFHIPFMYNFVGRPGVAHRIVRTALARLFAGSDIGQGYPGDEDTGSTSAWYVLSALGLYPLQVGTPSWLITSPLFRSATINLPEGRKIIIRAPSNSPENVYLQGLRVNGQSYDRTWLPHDLLVAGAELDFDLGPEPSTWGTGSEAAPPSLTNDDQVPQPMRDLTGPGHGTGSAEELFDNTSGTQLRLSLDDAVITWSFPDQDAAAAQLYTLTSATTDDDPVSWVLEGSDDGANWTRLDQRDGEVFDWRRQTRPFSITDPAPFRHYRLTITGGRDADTVSLAELELIG